MPLRLARDVTLTDVDSGAVLLDGRRGRYWQLNPSGAAVLRRLLEGCSAAEAAAGLASAAPVTADVAARDVSALVDALRSSHLLEVTP